MGIHECDKNMRLDDEFINGDLSFLVVGNKCRLLDGRRTTGIIENYFEDSAMFRWKITKYEDKGKYWDLPAEDIVMFQFEKASSRLTSSDVACINLRSSEFKKELNIEPNKLIKDETERKIELIKNDVIEWFKHNSQFFQQNRKIDFSSNVGSEFLASDLNNYMKSVELAEEETITTDTLVLNPNSGEWIKGMSIVLAEMGLASYNSRIPRTKDIFQGIGSKENRMKYLMNRIAFVRAFFSISNIKEVTLYRGMSTEDEWRKIKRTYLPCTFSFDVAKEFSDFSRDSIFKNSYIVKLTCPIEKLFITYLETEAMNRQYKEAEAIIFYEGSIAV